jgi:PAS domain S-box-containing protein
MRRPFQIRLDLALALMLVACVAVVSCFLLWTAQQAAREAMNREVRVRMSFRLALVERSLQEHLRGLEVQVNHMANTPTFAAALRVHRLEALRQELESALFQPGQSFMADIIMLFDSQNNLVFDLTLPIFDFRSVGTTILSHRQRIDRQWMIVNEGGQRALIMVLPVIDHTIGYQAGVMLVGIVLESGAPLLRALQQEAEVAGLAVYRGGELLAQAGAMVDPDAGAGFLSADGQYIVGETSLNIGREILGLRVVQPAVVLRQLRADQSRAWVQLLGIMAGLLLLSVFFLRWMIARSSRPLLAFAEKAAQGQDHPGFGFSAVREFHFLGQALENMVESLRRSEAGLRTANAELLRSNEDLRQSEEKFARLFRLSPDAIVLMRFDDGLVIDVNEAFSRLTGFAYGDAVGKSSHELGVLGNLEAREMIMRRIEADGQIDDFVFELERKDGPSLVCTLTCQVLSVGGESCILAVLRDVTELRRMQEVMVQTEKMISVGGIAAGVAHEINNPLGIIMASVQNLAQRTRADFPKNVDVARKIGLDMALLDQYMQLRGVPGFIATIQNSTMRAAEIIRHMLDFSRRSESKRAVCQLRAIVDRALALAGSDYDLKKEFDFKRIRIVRECDDELPEINCTETEIEQVVLNLLRNAAQALAAARSSDPVIVVRIMNAGSVVVLEVEDNGPGMTAEIQRRVFEPFFTTKPPGVGTGLGLSVSYFIVTRNHGGRMRVESSPGRGAKFVIELPALDRLASGPADGPVPS